MTKRKGKRAEQAPAEEGNWVEINLWSRGKKQLVKRVMELRFEDWPEVVVLGDRYFGLDTHNKAEAHYQEVRVHFADRSSGTSKTG